MRHSRHTKSRILLCVLETSEEPQEVGVNNPGLADGVLPRGSRRGGYPSVGLPLTSCTYLEWLKPTLLLEGTHNPLARPEKSVLIRRTWATMPTRQAKALLRLVHPSC